MFSIMLPKYPRLAALSAFFVAMFGITFSASATGLLIPKDRNLPPLAISYHRIEVSIDNGTATTKVDQAFRNHTSQVLEATYVFPVPDGASVDDFALYINGKRVEGKVLEKNQARGIYEEIVRRMADPGLLEWMGHNLFQARVYPVPAGGEQKVEIAFSQVLPFDGGVYKYTYPLKGAHGPSPTTLQDLTLTAKVRSKIPIRSLYSPSHDIYVRRKTDDVATVGFEKDKARLDQDFVLYYSVSQKDIGLNLLTYRPSDEPGYFLLMMSPKSSYAEDEILEKSVTFVIDTSGSMQGTKMQNAKEALKHCLTRLGPRDSFNIIRFSSDVESWANEFKAVTTDSVNDGVRFVDSMEAAGGTAIHEALLLAMGGRTRKTHLVVFITDGRPTVGETALESILRDVNAANETRARVFVFGVGDDLNAHLLDRIAEENGGTSAYVRGDSDMETTIASFFEKVSYPVLVDPKVDIIGGKTYGILPKRLPDLFRGSQVILTGRYRDAGDILVRLHGEVEQRSMNFDFEGTLPKESGEHGFIARLWATRQVGYLLDEIRLRGESKELRDEIIQLGTRFGIVTPYTSYLVTEPNSPMAPPNPRPIILGSQRPAPEDIRRQLEAQGGAGMGTGGPAGAPKTDTGARGWEMDNEAPAAQSRITSADELKAAEGSVAVESAKKIVRMKSVERSREDKDVPIRHVKGKTLKWNGKEWVDETYKSGMKTIEVRYMSEAYFDIAQQIPELAELMAVGTDVVIVRKNTALMVRAAAGKDRISTQELDSLR
ncbi:MAG: VWA domain-containing protein [Myxococcales bacterium]|nr:VWA domain-containing protein [Myxococcales bacterium]